MLNVVTNDLVWDQMNCAIGSQTIAALFVDAAVDFMVEKQEGIGLVRGDRGFRSGQRE
jgi:hypothetical protein